MQIDWPVLPSEGRSVAAAPASPWTGGGPWTFRRYALLLVLLGIPAALGVSIGASIGETQVAATIGALPLLLAILWRPELGLFTLLLLVPFEGFAQFSEAFTATKALGLYTGVVTVGHLLVRQHLVLKSAAFWLAVGFTLWSTLSVIGAVNVELAWWRLLTRYQLLALLFIAINVCWGRPQAHTLIWLFVLGAALAGVAGLFLAPIPEYEQMLRRTQIGQTGANQLAKTLQAAILLVPWLFTQVRTKGKILLAGLLFLMLSILITTGSRSVYISLFAGVAIALLAYRGATLSTRIGLVVGVTAMMAALVGVGWSTGLWATGLFDRLVNLWEEGLQSGNRLWIWSQGFLMGAENPLLGVGIGNYPLMMLRQGQLIAAHNDVVAHFAETGVPGILLYLGFMAGVLWHILRVRAYVLRACLVGVFVSANVASLANPSYALKIFWLHMALCILGGLYYDGVSSRAARSPEGAREQGPASAGGGAVSPGAPAGVSLP